MLKIITEILKRHSFPTKNVEEVAYFLGSYRDINKLVSVSVITSDDKVIGYHMPDNLFPFSSAIGVHRDKWRYCSLGSELVARLKGGER